MSIYEKAAFLNVRRCAGLYFWYSSDAELYVTLVVTVIRNGRVMIERTYSSDSLDEIVSEIPGNVPLLVSLDGSNVIHRVTDLASSENQVSHAFPGFSVKDFHIRRHDSGKGKTIVSLARKEDIIRFVEKFNEAGILVYDINLGPFSINSLEGISAGTGEVLIPFYTLYFDNNSLVSFKRSLQPDIDSNYLIEFGDEHLSSEFLVSLSLCYDFYKSRNENTDDQLLIDQRKELAAKKILSFAVLPFVILVFVALMINFLLLMKLEKENRILDLSLVSGKHQLSQIDSLRQAIMINQKVLDARHNIQSKYLAFYSDRIASCVEPEILLTEMNIYPHVSSSRKEDQYSFREGVVTISGNTENSVSLEAFVKSLSLFRWIEGVKILNFTEEKDGTRSFHLEIAIAEDQ